MGKGFVTMVLASSSLLLGCNEQISLRTICEQSPSVCQDISADGHCNKQRHDLILSRHETQKRPTDNNRYQLILKWESYAQCIELASQIEHIKLKEKRTRRVDNYLLSQQQLQQLAKLTEISDHPPLLYYHWSRYGSKQHLEKFLALEGTGALQTAQLQFSLATYYTKRDIAKAINLLYNTLTLYSNGAEVNVEIYSSLTNLFWQADQYQLAYMWGKVATLAGVEIVNMPQLKLKLAADKALLKALDQQAKKVLSDIDKGDFKLTFSQSKL